MATYSLSHLSDHVLLRDLSALVAKDRTTTAELLAHIAEVDERRLYAPAGYASMFAYCVQELHLSEDSARKRIHAARAARRFPAILPALAAGRLHLSGAVLLAPYLSNENARELLSAATHKTKQEIEHLIANYFPRLDVPEMIHLLDATSCPSDPLDSERAPGRVEPPAAASPQPQSEGVGEIEPCTRVAPLAPRRFALQLTMSQELHDKLRYAQELLGHQLPSGDITQVLERALDALISQLEKRKFAATRSPRPSRPSIGRQRHVPAYVKRAVWERDDGQCTFVGENGHRCGERRFLQFDHIQPVARGGQASVEGMRLRCRAHNQLEAERVYGVAFMRHKRQEALEARAARTEAAKAAQEAQKEVIPWLRALGFRADEARRAAERCGAIPDAPLEERVRLALTSVRA